MPSTIVLTALPAKYVRSAASTEPTLILKPYGRKLGIALVVVVSVHDVVRAVENFGDEVAHRLPQVSFYVSIRFRLGDKPPRGFAEAAARNELSQDAHTRVFDHCDPKCLARFDGRVA